MTQSKLERELEASVSMNERSNLVHLPVGDVDQSAIEAVLGYGDLKKLSIPQRTAYYNRVCESLGLNPLTRPFAFIELNGKLVMYALRDCTDQLRKIHTVSISIASREKLDDIYIVTARAVLPSGRVDESIGAVPLGNLRGEGLANALMKAETKAKRRVTLAICGLSVLDETELDGARDGARHNSAPHQEEPRQLPKITPSHQEGDTVEGDPDIADRLLAAMQVVKDSLAGCDSYDGVLLLRKMMGYKGKGQDTPWQVEYREAYNKLNAEQRSAIGSIWNHCDRQLNKLEEKYKPDASSSFVDADPEDDGR